MNQVMVITGTSKGLGRALAEYFVQRGYIVVGCSRGEATLDMSGYHHYQVDVGDEQQVRRWFRTVKKDHHRVDVLVCNAGVAPAALLLTMTSGEILGRSTDKCRGNLFCLPGSGQNNDATEIGPNYHPVFNGGGVA
jgi:NAD(P)-dependent dehydrogenase (short-subunit alcohol dehydrogenase family)